MYYFKIPYILDDYSRQQAELCFFKMPLTFIGLQGVIFQKTEVFYWTTAQKAALFMFPKRPHLPRAPCAEFDRMLGHLQPDCRSSACGYSVHRRASGSDCSTWVASPLPQASSAPTVDVLPQPGFEDVLPMTSEQRMNHSGN
jgi:hypothetical protein